MKIGCCAGAKNALESSATAVTPSNPGGIKVTSRISQFRTRNGWSLKELSERSGVPQNTLWRMERGYGSTLRNAFKVAEALELTIYELWSGSQKPDDAHANDSSENSPGNVRALRQSRGWTLCDLAKLCGVSKTTLAKIDAGHLPTLNNALRIAAAFGLSVHEIWENSDKELRS